MRTTMAVALILTAMAADAALAQRGVAPGRERQDLFVNPTPSAPQIQLRDGRPAPVIETAPRKKTKPVKRKRSRTKR
jgi:hypothetical protein